MRSGESTIGLFNCICRLTRVMSSCEDTAEMKLVDETEWLSEESWTFPLATLLLSLPLGAVEMLITLGLLRVFILWVFALSKVCAFSIIV